MLLLVAVAGGLAWGQYQVGAAHGARATSAPARSLAGSVIDTYFRGELAALRAIAGAPAVVDRDPPAMSVLRAAPGGDDRAFNGGLGWLDASGFARVSTAPGAVARAPRPLRPFVFPERHRHRQAVRERGRREPLDGARVIVMAVPTRDAGGRMTGVLAAR